MKTKLLIFVFLLACSGLIIPAAIRAAESDDATESQVISSKSPSAVTLSNIENLSIASRTTNSSMATINKKLSPLLNDWDEIEPPGGGEAAPRPVGDPAPIGDVTLPVALLALAIYFVYRGVTTSKRKSNL